MMDLDGFERLVLARRAVRRFLPTPIPDALLTRLLTCARWAPSGYNLQPTHWTVVTDPVIKRQLHPACMSQRQILEAPAIVIFSGDREAAGRNLDAALAEDLRAGAVDAAYAALMKKYVKLAFGRGPAGLGWLIKASVVPLLRLFKPVPEIPAVHKKSWVTKQVMLSAMNFMLAAKAAGLDTVPMEGFDGARVRRILNIPASHVIPVIIPVGHAPAEARKKTRLPAERMTHRNRWA
jgi:nitroreductase